MTVRDRTSTIAVMPVPSFGLPALVAFSSVAVGAGLARALVTTYLPVLLERIRDAPGLIGTLMLVNTLAGFVVPLVIGAWSDRLRARGHGRTYPVVVGGAVLAAGGLLAIAAGHASSYAALALFALIAYTGINAVTTGHRALIPQTFRAEGRAAATAGEEMALLIGTLLGVVAGGLLVEARPWAPFALGALLLPLLAAPTVRRMAHRERALDRELPVRPGLRAEWRAAKRPGVRLVLVAQALWVLAYVGLPPFFVLYAERVLGLAPSEAGLLLAAFGLLTGAAIVAAGAVPPSRQRDVLAAGALVMGLGMLGVAAGSSVAAVAPALVAVAAGFGILTTLGFPVFSSFIGEGEEGSYSGLYFAVRSVASAIALPLAGWTIAATGSYRTLFVVGGLAALAAIVPLVRLAPLRRLRALPWPRIADAARRGAVLAVATAVSLGAAVVINETELAEADEWVFDLVYGVGSSPQWLDQLLVSPHIRNYTIVTAVIGLGALRWGRRGPLRTIALVVGAALLAYASVRVCWAVWERPRPEEALGVPAANAHRFESYASFPSGHVAVSTALAVAGAALVPVLRLPLWLFAGAVALTRVSYGAHLPSDVLFALVLGYVAAAVVVPPELGLRPRLAHVVAERHALRALARATSVAALAAFLVLLATVGPPASPEGGVMPSEQGRDLQLLLLAGGAVCVACAWRWPPFGAPLALIAAALGVFAAMQYTPGFAFLAFAAFALPALLFLLAWPRVRTTRHAVVLGTFFAMVTAAGAYAAVSVHEREFGPAHPESPTRAPATWRVEWAWAGGVTGEQVTVKAQLNEDGDARLLVATNEDLRGAIATAVTPVDDDEPATFTVGGLTPDTGYFYGVEFEGRIDRHRIGRFRTFPAGPASFTFAFAGCARVGSNGAVFDAIRGEDPLLYVVTGDFHYANIDENSRDRFLEEYGRALGQPAQGALYRSTPVAYTWDDHDYGGDGSDATTESRPAARWAYRAAVPHYPLPADGPIHQAFTAGRVRFVLLDTRSERRPGRTMLGAAQKAWLKRELLNARDRAALTVVVSSVPWIGDGADGWGGFPAERAELSRFLARHRVRNLLMLGGDAHMLAIDDGSHSDYSGTGRAGFPVMHAAALDRPGSVKGGPYSEGAVPGAGQYGTVRIDDRGGRVRVTLTGRRHDGAELLRYAFTAGGP
jgi:predicted MFS family arabinose efflux permease